MSVESILELLASDMEIDEILKEYPFLRKKHILAAIDYASRLVGRNAQLPATPHEISRRR